MRRQKPVHSLCGSLAALNVVEMHADEPYEPFRVGCMHQMSGVQGFHTAVRHDAAELFNVFGGDEALRPASDGKRGDGNTREDARLRWIRLVDLRTDLFNHGPIECQRLILNAGHSECGKPTFASSTRDIRRNQRSGTATVTSNGAHRGALLLDFPSKRLNHRASLPASAGTPRTICRAVARVFVRSVRF